MNSIDGEIRRIFEKEPFGALERLVTQKLLDVAKRVAREELESEDWLRLMAQLSGRSYEQMRVVILEFLDVDVFNVSVENWVFFLDPLIESWDIDLETFGVEIVLNRRLALGSLKRFEFVEKRTSTAHRNRAGTGRVPQGYVPKRRRHRRGNRVSEDAEVHSQAAYPNVLLPGAAKFAGPFAFPRFVEIRRITMIGEDDLDYCG